MAVSDLAAQARSKEFREHLVDLLVRMCEHDTSIRADVDALREAEGNVFDILEAGLRDYGVPGLRLERRPINPAIAEHPFFSQLYYTRRKDRPEGLSVEETYKGRANLLALVDSDGASNGKGVKQAMNLHIDVVPPYFPPRVEGDTVFGRGSGDDKGNAVALMGALKLVGEYLRQTGKKLNQPLTCMFVIEEEMGGNGSLSAAIDRELKKRYDSLMVLEVCESKIYPGNRGCVWYKVEGEKPGVNLFEAAAFIIEQIEHEGRAIRSESDHPLFPHRPVQTCHGIIGPYGEHPSRINAKVVFDVEIGGGDAAAARSTVEDVIGFALAEYTGVYGDKTKETIAETGKPKVDHHYDLEPTAKGFRVTVHGKSGHMGSIFINDGAITKMMTMVRALVRSRAMIAERAGAKDAGAVRYVLADWDDVSKIVMEGGQGFVPTHRMEDVMARIRDAVERGADSYFRRVGVNARGSDVFQVTYEKLHNAAFAGDPDSPDMRNAIEAAKAANVWKDEDYAQGIRGWDVSCDSRIFACEYPDMPVITTGPGSLNYAHSDQEQIDIPEMVGSAEMLAYYILKQTGTID